MYPLSLKSMFASFWCHRLLILQMAKREIAARYKGSVLGLLWSFIIPLLMLAVYTFVFSFVFQARWGSGTENRGEFAIILFCGLLVYNSFAECINRAPSLVLGNAIYVKKVVFPLEVLPGIAVLSSLFNVATSILVLLLGQFLLMGTVHWTALFFPIVFVPLIFFILGLSWMLSSLGVYLRDLGQIVGVVTTILLFLSPIFYPISAVPERLQFYLALNPLNFVIGEARATVLWGELPDWSTLSVYCLGSLAIAWCGYFWFQKTRKGFADVI